MDNQQLPKPHVPTATILTVILAVAIIAGGAYAYKSFISNDSQESFISPEETVKEFYLRHINYEGNPLVDRQYAQSPFADKELVDKIDAAIASFGEGGGFDPVLCAQDIPNSVTVKSKTKNENTAKVTVEEDFWGTIREAEVTLTASDDGWKITDISCGPSSNNNQTGIQTIVGDYIRENISELSQTKEVLGGKFYLTKIRFIGNNLALVDYEDGHIALTALAQYTVDDAENVKIDSFKDMAGNFEKTGNLTINNPGQKADTWYLVYEKPGQPALTAELIFSQNSICVNGDSAKVCDTLSLKAGDRVKITGQLVGNKLTVLTLSAVK